MAILRADLVRTQRFRPLEECRNTGKPGKRHDRMRFRELQFAGNFSSLPVGKSSVFNVFTSRANAQS